MPRVTPQEIHNWLEPSKYPIDPDLDLDEFCRPAVDILWSKLGTQFDTSTWLDVATTPSLVRTMISMLTSSFAYGKSYSEALDSGSPYADRLYMMVLGSPPTYTDGLVGGLLAGTITLVDDPQESPANSGTISFLPDDDEPKFSMGTIF